MDSKCSSCDRKFGNEYPLGECIVCGKECCLFCGYDLGSDDETYYPRRDIIFCGKHGQYGEYCIN